MSDCEWRMSLPSGRCMVPVSSNRRNDDDGGCEPSSSSALVALASVSSAAETTTTSRRRQRQRGHEKQQQPTFTWGTPGAATDFTHGAAASSPVHMLAFRHPAQLAAAVKYMLELWPDLRCVMAPTGSPIPPPPPPPPPAMTTTTTTAAVATTSAGTMARGRGGVFREGGGGTSPPRLGKRDKPDGRVLQPPKKRMMVGGDHDPGFQS